MMKGKQEWESITVALLPCHFPLLDVVSCPTVNDDTLQHFMF